MWWRVSKMIIITIINNDVVVSVCLVLVSMLNGEASLADAVSGGVKTLRSDKMSSINSINSINSIQVSVEIVWIQIGCWIGVPAGRTGRSSAKRCHGCINGPTKLKRISANQKLTDIPQIRGCSRILNWNNGWIITNKRSIQTAQLNPQ